MADRYWVGGTGNWSSTARWSASSGGASGASVPTSADNVFFDANSAGAPNVDFTVTVDATSNCADIDIGVTSALTKIMTLAGSSTLNVYGSWRNATSATYTRTFTGTIFFLATTTGKVITTNGVTLTTGSINFNGAGGGWTLGSALTVGPTSGTGTITVTQGTFDTSSTGNYSVTTSAFISTGTSARTINLNASTITLNFEGTGLNLSGSNITFNAGTSQINHTAATPTIIVGGFTLYNFSFTYTFAGNANLLLSNGSATFNNLTVVGPTSETAGLRTMQVTGNNVTINGALTLGSANTVIKRVQVFSDVIGTQRTFTFNGASSALTTLSNVDFRDIVFATAGGSPVSLPASGTKLGNGGNNSQITFAAGTNCYWTGNTSGSTNDNRWSDSSGGSPSTSFFPLAQDTLIFDQSGTPANHTVTNSRSFWFGALDFSARSTAITFATGTTSIVLFKALTLSSAVTLTGTTGAFSFQQGAGAQTIDITPAGVAFTQNIVVNVNPTSSVRLLGDITNSGQFTLTRGALDLGGFQLTCLNFNSDNANTRSIAFGATGSIKTTIQAGAAWDIRTLTGFTVTGSKQVIVQPASGLTATTIYHRGTGASESNAISMQVIATSGALTLTGTSIFLNVDFSQFTMTSALNNAAITIYGNLKLGTANTLTSGTNAWTFAATSGTKTIESAGATITMPVVFNGVGGTWQLVDSLTIASDRSLTLTNGTLDGNGKNVSAGSFALGAGTKTLTLGSGTWTITGSGASAWNANTNATGLTVSASTGTISLTSASAKTFAGGGFTWPTLNQGGAGALTISGNNTFAGLTNTVQPATITVTAGTTQSFTGPVTLAGTSGNLITLNSTTPGTRFTFTLPVGAAVSSLSFCSISDCIGYQNSYWRALRTNGCVNAGNNLGWIFAPVSHSAHFGVPLV